MLASRYVENELYKFGRFTSNEKVLVAEVDNVSRLWHERMGHLNYKILSLMKRFEMVYGLPNFSERQGVCE